MKDDELAQALESELPDARASDTVGRRIHPWWRLLIATIVLATAIVAGLVAWPRATPGAPPATQGNHGAAQPGPGLAGADQPTGENDAGADLLTAAWPSQAITALQRDVGLREVTRLLFTRTQITATGPASSATTELESTDSAQWSDYVYVEDRALDLGAALIAPAPAELFSITGFDASVIPALVTNAPRLTGATDAKNVYVIVARDTVSDGAPVRIQVYLGGGAQPHVVTADAAGAVLSAE